MSAAIRQPRFQLAPSPVPLNAEKIPVASSPLPVPPPASAWLDQQYGYIGGRHRGNVVDCLLAGNKEFSLATKRQHELNRALVAVCWHLARKVVEDDLEYEIIIDLPRWKSRHIKPKLDDDVAARCRFLAILLFSDETGRNDNGASKKGRIVAHLIESGVTEDSIEDHLSRTGGVSRVYEEALANAGTEDGCGFPGSSARPKRSSSTRQPTLGDAQIEHEGSDPVRVLKRLVEDLGLHDDLEPSIILANLNDHASLAETNPGDELLLTVERTDCGGNCFVFRVNQFRPAGEA